MKIKSNKVTVTCLLFIFLNTIYCFSILNSTNNSISYVDSVHQRNLKDIDRELLKDSGYWDLTGTPIFIDGDATGVGAQNWTWVEDQIWFGGGNGIKGSPYIIENVTIDGQNSSSCITIINSDVYFIIENCSLFNCSSSYFTGGIELRYVINGRILNNNCSNNKRNGIYLTYSDNNTISGNLVSYNDVHGIRLRDDCDNNSISENIVNDNWRGIALYYGDDNLITENSVFDNNQGIKFANSDKNKIISNNITDNLAGFEISQEFMVGCHYNLIYGNKISNNSVYGIIVTAGSGDNTFYNNSLTNNGYNAKDNGTNNYWDNGTIGNYWDDYGGVDTNDDGIGDTPYIIQGSAGSQDNYPIWWDRPVISINIPSTNDIFDKSPDFDISIDEGIINTTWYTLDEGLTNITFTGLTGNIDQTEWNKKVDGLVTIKFFANDSKGYIGYIEVTVLKESVPQITINSPSLNEIFGFNAPEFNITIDDLSPINTTWYTIDGGLTNYTFSGMTEYINQTAWDLQDDGLILIRFYANDSHGYLGFKDINVIKDTIDPMITIISPNNNEVFGTQAPTFQLSIYDANLDTMWYTLDNGLTNTTFMANGTIAQSAWGTLSDGIIVLTFYTNDTAGNLGFSSVSIQKSLAYWQLNPLVIDDAGLGDYTWAQAALQGWCSGSGTWNNPYIIEFVIINGLNSSSCIEIRNSNVPFIIRNSVMSYSGSGDFDAGIKLDHVNNGLLYNITGSSNNNFGIILMDCLNNTITESNINDNGVGGILLYYSDNNSIIDNAQTIQNNGKYGILLNSSNSNIISGNYISNCQYGIYFYDSSENQIIYNIFVGNDIAIEETAGSGSNNFDQNDGIPSDGELPFPTDLLIIISIIAIAAITSITVGIVVKKKLSQRTGTKLGRKMDKKQATIRKKLEKKMAFVDYLIKENKIDIALKNLNKIESLAKSNGLIEFVNEAEEKLIEIKKLELDTINRIKQTITNLGTKFSRLQLTDISEKSDVKNEVLIEKIMQEMLNKKEIHGEYFASSKALALEVTTPMITREKKKELNVFLSYSTLDADHFEISRIVRRLELYSEISNVYFWEADSGANIVTFMEQTLKKTNAFVLFCSEHSMKSKAVEDEWQAAFQLRKEGLMKIVPVYEKDEYLPYLLKPILNVKFSKDDFDGFIQKLYEEILR